MTVKLLYTLTYLTTAYMQLSKMTIFFRNSKVHSKPQLYKSISEQSTNICTNPTTIFKYKRRKIIFKVLG